MYWQLLFSLTTLCLAAAAWQRFGNAKVDNNRVIRGMNHLRLKDYFDCACDHHAGIAMKSYLNEQFKRLPKGYEKDFFVVFEVARIQEQLDQLMHSWLDEKLESRVAVGEVMDLKCEIDALPLGRPEATNSLQTACDNALAALRESVFREHHDYRTNKGIYGPQLRIVLPGA